ASSTTILAPGMVRQSATPPCAKAPAQLTAMALGAGVVETGVRPGRGQSLVLCAAGAAGIANGAAGCAPSVGASAGGVGVGAGPGALVVAAGGAASGAAGAGAAAAQPIRNRTAASAC